jgi:peptidoglycan/LPS O-acetylase OafA/YrhL
MKHIKELDSLRGIAAVIVMISHYSVLYPTFRQDIHHTPFDLFFSASASVSLFFALSGFVLSISFFNNKKQSIYKQFILKRFFRLYTPYIVSVFIAMLLYTALSSNGISELNSWFNGTWTTPLTLQNFFQHIFFIGSFESGIYNPIYWSLVIEMRVSIIFFILIYTVTNFNIFKNIIIWGGDFNRYAIIK